VSDQGTLIVCGTPIGNLGDVSDRLRETLANADVVFAEDTRRTATLLRHVGATPPVRSLFVGNEAARSDELLALLEQGKTVALVSDAGMPGVSDPGSEVVRMARSGGHVVTVVPGPSAVTAAVTAAGFGGDRFVFEGFLPRKGQERRRRLEVMADEVRPVVLFVSPHRFRLDLADLAEHLGPRRAIFIGRELTKLHEETWVGSIADAMALWADRESKGEFTVVIAPGEPREPSLDEAITIARSLIGEGASASDAARSAARDTGVSRRSIYEVLIADQERS
jgi:16S rRNA (cytidine1402-2'-O)-methyltransferase